MSLDRALNMRPTFPINNIADRGRVDSEPTRKRSTGSALVSQCANFLNGVLIQNSTRMRAALSETATMTTLAVPVGIVVGNRSEEEVVRSDTRRIVACVAYAHTVWNRAVGELVHQPMRTLAARLLAQGKHPIAVVVNGRCPKPAVGGAVNLPLEAFPQSRTRSVVKARFITVLSLALIYVKGDSEKRVIACKAIANRASLYPSHAVHPPTMKGVVRLVRELALSFEPFSILTQELH